MEVIFIDLGAGALVASALRRNASASASFACFLSALSTAASVRCSCSSSVIVDIVITVLSFAGPSWEGDLKVLDLNRSSLRKSSALIDQGLVTKVVLKYSGIGPSLRKRYSGNFLWIFFFFNSAEV